MPLSIGTNNASLKAIRQLDRNSDALSGVFERLSSGQRINRASDDAAGLAISTTLKTTSRVYSQALRNVADGVSLLSVASGALTSLSEIVTRQRELAQQAASGTYSPRQRSALNKEAFALTQEYNRIVRSTSFNGQYILDGTDGTLRLQHGYGSTNSTSIVIGQEFGVAAGTGTYQAGVSYATGVSPSVVTSADFNGDGKLDLVSSDINSDSLGVYLGNGDGTFQARVSYATGDSPDHASVGDFNGDGIVDLAAANSTAGTLNVFIGRGDGTFQSALTLSISTNPDSMVIIDANGDGLSDVVWTTGSTQQAGTFLSNGDGTFSSKTFAINSTGTVSDTAAADFDGDGIMDLVSVGSVVYRGNGDGTFQASYTINPGTTVHRVTTADINQDGAADIITSDSAGAGVYLGNGNGTFQSRVTLVGGIFSREAEVSDLNGDGHLDVVMADLAGGIVNLFLGNGNGSFQAVKTISVGSFPLDIVTEDFNGDGIRDLIATNYTTAHFTFLSGIADPTGRRNNFQSELDLISIQGARKAIDSTGELLDRISLEQGAIGAVQSRMRAVTATLQVAAENLTAAGSRIVDADIAHEAAQLARGQILQQAATAVLAQANIQPRVALTLLGLN